MKTLEFFYDSRGFGELRLMADGLVVDNYLCRTGSINRNGKLKNAMPPGEYVIPEPSVATDELGMYIHDGKGWKIRLFIPLQNGKLKRTRLLVHPDGNKPGTGGCCGIQGTDASALRYELDKVIEEQDSIPMIVKQEAGE